MKSLKLVTVGTILFSSLILGASVQAADTATYNSFGEVTFEEDTDPTNPVDPTDPTEPVEPGPETPPTGTPGPLSIDFASNLKFGTQKMSTVDKTYYASAQEVTSGKGTPDEKKYFVPLYAQVTDKRGDLTGWNLTLKQEAQFESTTSKKELKGAVVNFSGGVVNSETDPADMIWPNVTNADFSLTPDGEASKLMSADADTGFGTYVMHFGNEIATGAENEYKSVSIDVPGKTVKVAESYKTNLIWELQNVPDGGVVQTAKEKLTAKIAEAEALIEADYTPESWTTFKTALTDAKEVLDEQGSQDADYSNATKSLTKAVTELVKA